METEKEIKEVISNLEKKIEDLKKRIPPHSVPIDMIQELEDLEDELSAKKRELNNSGKDGMR
jgi:prefoldin subunit 5